MQRKLRVVEVYRLDRYDNSTKTFVGAIATEL